MNHTIMELFLHQDNFNKRVSGENWMNKDLDWLRCVWVECAEAMNYLDWKWWKQHKNKHGMLCLELIDVFIFGISHMMSEHKSPFLCAEIYQRSQDQASARTMSSAVCYLENVVSEAASKRGFDLRSFIAATRVLGLTSSDICAYYAGKNALNQFRQEMGYSQGGYNKQWGSMEDNEVLLEIIDNTPSKSHTIASYVAETTEQLNHYWLRREDCDFDKACQRCEAETSRGGLQTL